jgi:hypothetical protein
MVDVSLRQGEYTILNWKAIFDTKIILKVKLENQFIVYSQE